MTDLVRPAYVVILSAMANGCTAIWDNRSVFHTATFDYDGLGDRFGNRAVGLGEKPYLDPNSKSRREALSQEAPVFIGDGLPNGPRDGEGGAVQA